MPLRPHAWLALALLSAACSSTQDDAAMPAGAAGANAAGGASGQATGGVGGQATGGAGGAAAGAPANGAVTFHRDVEPILQKSCQGCHVTGGIAPFPLVTYGDTMNYAALIVAQTAARTMPPWGARTTDECTPPAPYKDNLELSDAQLATLKAWSEGGAIEGDPKDAPPPAMAMPLSQLDGSQSVTTPPYTVASTGDAFRCSVLDPQVTSMKYLTANYFVPGNRTVVHHALAFALPPGANAPGATYDCPGGPGVTGATLVSAWAPGGVPYQYPDGVALPIQPGTRFIVQVHYHPHANATTDPDATTFQFKLTDQPPTWVVTNYLLGNFKTAAGALGIGLLPGPDDPPSGPEFMIPSGAQSHTETMEFTVPKSGKGASYGQAYILSVGAHMHLAGVDEKITQTPAAGGGDVCLLQEPGWNFSWQRAYQYDVPIESLPKISPGDRLQMRCTYDNTLGNAQLAEGLAEANLHSTSDIHLGESTLDEMCLGMFGFVTKAE